MNFDLPTLLAADSFVTATTGTLLVIVWLVTRNAPSALWWGLANLAVSVATAILMFKHGVPDAPSRIAVATCLNTAAAMFWAAAHRSHHSGVPPLLLVAGP